LLKLIQARLPAGNVSGEDSVHLTHRGDLHTQVLDVLFGPRRPGEGRGVVEVESRFGRHVFERDFRTGRLETRVLRGRPLGDLFSPGEILFGCSRSELVTGRRPRKERRGSEIVRAHLAVIEGRLAAIKRRLAGLPAPSGKGPPGTTPVTAPEGLAALEAGVEALFRREARRLCADRARDQVIEACARECSSRGETIDASPLVETLRRKATALAQAKRTCESVSLLPSGIFLAVLAAVGLAGAATLAVGIVAGEAGLLALGFTLLVSPVPALAVFRRRAERHRRRLAARLRQVEESCRPLLLKVGMLPPAGSLTPETLEEAVLRARSRERLSAVAEALKELLPGAEEEARRKRRLDILQRGIPPSIRGELAALALKDPLLGLPGLLDRVREDMEALCGAADGRLERETAAARREGMRQALEAERRQLLRRRERLGRHLQGERTLPLPPRPDSGNDGARGTRLPAGWPRFLRLQDKDALRLARRIQEVLRRTSDHRPLVCILPREVSLPDVRGRLAALRDGPAPTPRDSASRRAPRDPRERHATAGR